MSQEALKKIPGTVAPELSVDPVVLPQKPHRGAACGPLRAKHAKDQCQCLPSLGSWLIACHLSEACEHAFFRYNKRRHHTQRLKVCHARPASPEGVGRDPNHEERGHQGAMC